MPNKKKLSADDPQAHHPPHYLHELPLEDEERLEKLFNKLDKDGNGKIDILDLSAALKEHGVHHHYAEKFLRSSNADSDDLSLADFIHYVREHEKNLRLHFSNLDRNKDGRIDLEELARAFNDLGIPLDRGEAKNLLARMDQDGNLNISYDEWRDFLLLAPSQDIHQLLTYWRHSTSRTPTLTARKIGANAVSTSARRTQNLVHIGTVSGPSAHTARRKSDMLLLYTSDGKLKKAAECDRAEANASRQEEVGDEEEGEEPEAARWRPTSVEDADLGDDDAFFGDAGRPRPTRTSGTLRMPGGLKREGAFNRARRMFHRLEHLTVYIFKYLDIGEDMNVPDDFTQTELQTGMWWRHLAAGGIAGAVSRTCTAPLDRLKVFLQVQPAKQRISDCFTCMVKEGGLTGLWRGNGINVLKIAPESAIKFAAYEQIKRFIKGDSPNPLTIYERFCAGALAGGFSQTAIYPLEVLKTRLALRKTGQYTSIADAAYKIYSAEGLKSFYRGYVPNILGIIPYAGIDLAVYETLKKKYLKTHSSEEQPSFYMLLACGSASSTLGQMCSYPLALIRTRLQAQVVTQADDPRLATMTGVFRAILEKEGVLGLYRGITPNFIKVMPAVSISYVVYEYSSRILGVNMT